ncbi:sensor domain-containing protein [Halocatena halophila]|uniref:sensor domain-containing protein n=1 Tax=Halocatena halophila TaxID=2814576 RepID=UPI002ED42842
MELPPRSSVRQWVSRLVRSPLRVQSYRNLCYLGVLFVLVTVYTALFSAIIAVGFSLLVYLVGIVVLGAIPPLFHWIAAIERLTIRLVVGVDIRPATSTISSGSYWQRYRRLLTDRQTWGVAVYLFGAFWLASLSVGVLLAMIATGVSFLGAPLYYQHAPVLAYGPIPRTPMPVELLFGWDSLLVGLQTTLTLGSFRVDSLWAAVAVSLGGAVILLVALELASVLTTLWMRVAQRLLSTERYWEPLRARFRRA